MKLGRVLSMNIKKLIVIIAAFAAGNKVIECQWGGFTQEQIDRTAQAIFSPAIPYLTTSLNEKAAESLFGGNGFDVGEPLLTYIKKFYFYLEYLTRLELAAKLLTLAKDNGLTQYNQAIFSWNELIATIYKKLGVTTWPELTALLQKTTPDWSELRTALNLSFQYDLKDLFQGSQQPSITFQEIITTSFWTALPLTTIDFVNSDFWQNYLKFTIKGTYQIDESLVNSIAFNQNMVFKYIPKIELAYYSADFTDLRNQNELLRVSLILNESYRSRLQQQSLDWKNLKGENLLQATDDFSQTLFFQIASAAVDTSLIGKNQYSPYEIDSQGNIVLKKQLNLPTPYPEYMTCLAMALMLQKLTYTLFEPKGTDTDPLTATVTKLKTIQDKPDPNFLVYDELDYAPLEDLTTIIKLSATRKQLPPVNANSGSTTGSEQVTIQAVGSSEAVVITGLQQVVSDFFSAIESLGKDIVATGKEIGDVIENEAKVLYYSSGLAEAITGISETKADQLSAAAKAAREKDWANLKVNVDKVINDAVSIGVHAAGGVIDSVLALVDKTMSELGIPAGASLADDFSQVLDSTVTVLSDALQSVNDLFLTVVEGTVRLTEDGISMVSKVAIELARGQLADAGAALGEGVLAIVEDTVSTLLEAVTLAFQDVGQFVKDVLNFVSSFVQLLTDMFIDIVNFVTDVSASFWCYSPGGLLTNAISGQKCDPSLITQETNTFLQNHKRTISQIVTTGILVGMTIATSGGTAALLAGESVVSVGIMAGFGGFAIVGGYQKDEEAINTRAEQTEFLDDYTTYIINKEQITKQEQAFVSDEYTQKFAAELNNRERGLGLFQNYLNDTVIGIREQLNDYIGSWQASLLTPDQNNLIPADIGRIYGFSTNFYDLNISQGFSLYSNPRGTFTQEIAESPQHTITNPSGQGQISDTKFWFNQRITTDLAQSQDPLSVDIKFHTFYLLDNFYVGLYIGGNPLDKESILKRKEGNLDQPHLAKMLVYRKESKDTPVTLGLYEFESQQFDAQNNWFSSSVQGPEHVPGIWYRIKAELSANTLKCKIWQDGEPEPGWQTFTVTPCPQQTYGMIFSGAAGEFEVLTPQITISANPKIRPPITTKTEKQRELDARKTLNRFMKPSNFSTFDITPMDKNEIIKGNYLYQLINENQAVDYVTTGDYAGSETPENIGQQPTAATDALVSLITGKGMQNNNGTLQEKGWAQDISTVYRNTFTTINDTVQATLDTAINTYAQSIMGPSTGFPFGSYTVTPTSLADVQNHLYVYTAIGTAPVLTYEGTPLKDDAGKTLTDNYFIFTLLPISSAYYTGMPYQDISTLSKELNQEVAMVSLMTGNVYSATKAEPVDSGRRNILPPAIMQNMPSELKNAIDSGYTTWVNAFEKAVEAPPKPKPVPPKPSTSITTPTTGGSNTSLGGFGLGGFGSNTFITQNSFNQRLTDAGGDDLSLES